MIPRQATVAILAVVLAGRASAQGCPELPEMPPPPPKNCGLINLVCKSQERQEQEAWQAQMRRFGTPIEFSSSSSNQLQQEQSYEYLTGGCRGSIVNIEVAATQLVNVRYELLAPSGTTAASEELRLQSGRAVGRAIRLPESGFYKVRLIVRGNGEQRQVCERIEGSGNNRRCINGRYVTVYPVKFRTMFLGNAEAPAVRLGEDAEGTVTQREPMSRRVTIEAGQATTLRVAPNGGSVTCRLEGPAGNAIDLASVDGGCVAMVPVADRDATYVLAVETAVAGAVGVRVTVDAAASTTKTLAVGTDHESGFTTTGPTDQRQTDTWDITLQAGSHMLTIIPSGLAQLDVEVLIYNKRTEEIVVDRVQANTRRTIPAVVTSAGDYVVRVTARSYDRSQPNAKYTIRMDAGQR